MSMHGSGKSRYDKTRHDMTRQEITSVQPAWLKNLAMPSMKQSIYDFHRNSWLLRAAS